jgi:hypothetical protein
MTFSYDQTRPTARDKMRHALGDITDPGVDPDETYDSMLVELGGSWRRAAAAIARSFAARRISKPTSFTDVGVMAVGWSDPAGGWLKLAAALEADAEAEEHPATDDRSLYVVAPSRLDMADPFGEYSNGLRGWR